jgi:hypothetical protein
MTTATELASELFPLIEIKPSCGNNEDSLVLASSTQLQDWYRRVRDTATIHRIIVDDVARNPVTNKLLFLKISPQVQPHKSGETRPWNVFVTGSASSLCAVFNTSSNAEDHYALLVEQYRVGLGRTTLEIAAGLNTSGGDLRTNALSEFTQETGINLTSDDLVFQGCANATSPSTVSETTATFFALQEIDVVLLEKARAITGQHREKEENSFGVTAQLLPLNKAFAAVQGDLKSVYALSQALNILALKAIRNQDLVQAKAFLQMACAPRKDFTG